MNGLYSTATALTAAVSQGPGGHNKFQAKLNFIITELRNLNMPNLVGQQFISVLFMYFPVET